MTDKEVQAFLGKTVRMVWVDPTAAEGGWITEEEALELVPSTCYTVGIILKVDDGVTVIAGSGSVDADDGGYGDVNALPTCCVREIKEYHESTE